MMKNLKSWGCKLEVQQLSRIGEIDTLIDIRKLTNFETKKSF